MKNGPRRHDISVTSTPADVPYGLAKPIAGKPELGYVPPTMLGSSVTRGVGPSVLTFALISVMGTPAVARPKRPATPIEREPVVPAAIAAPDIDTIPDDLQVPPPPSPTQGAPHPASSTAPTPAGKQSSPSGATPEQPAPDQARVEGDDTTYIIDTSSAEAIDADVLAAQAQRIDPRALDRQGRTFLAAGAPLLAVGAAAMISGAFLGQFESDADISPATWVPVMVGGALLMTAGIPLTVRGVLLRREAKAGFEAEASARWIPSVQRTREGTWTGGLAARF